MKSNAEIKTIGTERIKKPFGQILLLTNIYKVLSIVGNVIPVLGWALVSGALSLGYIDALDRAIKGENTNVMDLFKYFKTKWGDAFYLTASATLYMWPVYVIFMVGSLFVPLLVILLPIAIVVAIIRNYDCAMGTYLLFKDNNLNGKEALQTSVKLMKGHKFGLFKLELSLIRYYIINIFLNYGEPTIDSCKLEFYEEIFLEATTVSE